MALGLSVPSYSYGVPWFIFDIYNKQLITSKTIPGDITDSKNIFLVETQVPGLNYSPIMPVGGGNRKISLTLPIVRRNNTIGNLMLLKQFDNLRNQATGAFNIFAEQFTPMPKVLYFWGAGSIPLVYWVAKCDFVHKQYFVNQLGNPQYTEVSLELWLDETDPIYKGEEVFRKAMTFVSEAFIAVDALVPGKEF